MHKAKIIDTDNEVTPIQYKKISIVLNVIWGLGFLPITALTFMAGVATIMMTDSGKAGKIMTGMIIVDAFLFWIIPLIILASIILSFVFRKKEKFILSFLIQLAPLANAILAFAILFLIFAGAS